MATISSPPCHLSVGMTLAKAVAAQVDFPGRVPGRESPTGVQAGWFKTLKVQTEPLTQGPIHTQGYWTTSSSSA